MATGSIPHLLVGALAAIFALAAAIDLAGPRVIPAWLRQWHHPRAFYRVMAALQFATAFFLATPSLRVWGLILAALMTFFQVVALLNHRQWRWAAAGMLLMLTLAPASLALY